MANISIPVPPETENAIRDMLTTMARQVIQEVTTNEITGKEYLTYKEACQMLGIAHNTLTAWRSKGLKTIVIDGKKFVSKTTLYDFLNSFEE